jgi:DNA-binding transcriptional regulator YhcF (GntR family)
MIPGAFDNIDTRVLLAVVDARHQGRRAPSYRDLAEIAGCSPSRAFTAVHRLFDAGLLQMDNGAGSLVASIDLVADSRRLP